jgi:hypothetical protein
MQQVVYVGNIATLYWLYRHLRLGDNPDLATSPKAPRSVTRSERALSTDIAQLMTARQAPKLGQFEHVLTRLQNVHLRR